MSDKLRVTNCLLNFFHQVGDLRSTLLTDRDHIRNQQMPRDINGNASFASFAVFRRVITRSAAQAR